MKKKLTLLFTLLAFCVSGWAADGYITVKIADGTNTNGPSTYGDANSGAIGTVTLKNTLTSKALSGMAGLTLSSNTSADVLYLGLAEETSYSSFKCLAFKPSAVNATDKLTITAPSGYIITSYYLEAGYWTSSETHTLTASAGTGTTSYTTSKAPANGTKGLEVSGINASSTTISIKSNSTKDNNKCLMINKFTVTIFPKELYDAETSITSGRLYRIFTKNNGTAEGDTKYYLTTSGTLTTESASAGEFVFNATTTDGYVPAGYAWKISNGSYRFTNRPYQAPGQTHLNTTSGNDRDTYEAQVFYLNGGKYAVRSTNFDGSGSNYVQNSYWNVVADITDDGIPDATYDDTEGTKHYVWQLEEIVSVTYNLIYEGNTIATTGPLNNTSGTYNGTATLPTDTWSNPYCSYSYSPTTITSETRTVNVTMTWDGPFTISSDYASATWGYLKLRGKYAKYDEDLTITSDVAYPLYASKDDVRYTDEGLWAFVGNPIQGVRLFNKAAGSGKCIQWTTQPQMASTSNGNAVYWKIGKLADTGFLLNYGGYYLHDLGGNTPGKLGIWNGSGASTDSGSAFVVEDLDWRDQAVFAVQDYAKDYTMNVYFGVDETAYNATVNGIKNYVGDFTESMYNTVTSDYSGLTKYPATGYYYLKHKGSSYYLTSDGTKPLITEGKTLNSVVRFIQQGTGNSYYISLLNSTNLRSQGTGYLVINSVEYPTSFSGSLESDNSIALFSNGAYMYAASTAYDGQPCGFGEVYGDASRWILEDATSVTLTLNSDGAEPATYYSTLYLPFDATISGATAYTLAKSGNYLVPTEVEDNEVPAGTPVLLKGTSATATATINSGSAFSALEGLDSKFKGTYTEISTARATGEYILGMKDGVVGFYQRAEGKKIGANKAYLKLDADISADAKGLVLMFDDDDETGIRSIDNGQLTIDDDVIYNLAGQRVNKAQKGIYIINGKKVLK